MPTHPIQKKKRHHACNDHPNLTSQFEQQQQQLDNSSYQQEEVNMKQNIGCFHAAWSSFISCEYISCAAVVIYDVYLTWLCLHHPLRLSNPDNIGGTGVGSQ